MTTPAPLQTDMREFYKEHGLLRLLHLDVLYACDLDCHHCYLDDKKKAPASADELIAILDQGARLGAIEVAFSGGEVFLRKDFLTILAAARRLRYSIAIKTHGGRMTREDARRLGELAIKRVDFSVYALEAEPHDAFTKVPGSLARTLRAIDWLIEEGVPVRINCSVTSFNVHHYRALVAEYESRGVDVRFNPKMKGTNSGMTVAPYDLHVDHEDHVRYHVYAFERRAGPSDWTRGVFPDPAGTSACAAGHTSLYVSPELKVWPCVAFPTPLGDLREQTLGEILGSRATARVRGINMDHPICNACAARTHCTYCPGSALIESGGVDWDQPPQNACEDAFAKLEAHERYVEGERTRPHVGKTVMRRKRKGEFLILNHLTHAP